MDDTIDRLIEAKNETTAELVAAMELAACLMHMIDRDDDGPYILGTPKFNEWIDAKRSEWRTEYDAEYTGAFESAIWDALRRPITPDVTREE